MECGSKIPFYSRKMFSSNAFGFMNIVFNFLLLRDTAIMCSLNASRVVIRRLHRILLCEYRYFRCARHTNLVHGERTPDSE